MQSATDSIDTHGYAMLRGVFSVPDLADLREKADVLLESTASGVLCNRGVPYAVRNLLTLWPEIAKTVWDSSLRHHLVAVLGNDCALVRAILFDKPIDHAWSLPWHKDLTIALKSRPRSPSFSRLSRKSGVIHCEAPTEVLTSMLTIRIHLDDVTEENGPPRVVAGTHTEGRTVRATIPVVPIFADAGDVLMMRPLLTHRSERGLAQRRRRVLHIECAAHPDLGGVEWEWYVRPENGELSS